MVACTKEQKNKKKKLELVAAHEQMIKKQQKAKN
jgi:hypothetical protein